MGKLTKHDALVLYRLMCRTRARQESLIINRSNVPGPELTAMGQEAMAVVPPYVLLKLGILKESVVHGDHRSIFGNIEVLDELADDSEAKLSLYLLRNYFARGSGGNFGRSGNQHVLWPARNLLGLGSSDMGVWVAVLLGFLEEKMRATGWDSLPEDARPVGLAYFGDGAANQGIIHEAMNWAWRFRLPAIFCINNNQFALFTHPDEEHGRTELYRRAEGYGGMIGFRVDGTDPAAIYDVMVEAVRHAQKRIPVVIEFLTFRLTGHNEDHIARVSSPGELRENRDFFNVKKIHGLSDDDMREFREAARREPLRRTQWWLVGQGLLPIEKSSEEPLRDPVIDEERERADELALRVLGESGVSVSRDAADRSVFPPLPASCVPAAATPHGAKHMTYNEAFSWAVGELMAEDPRVVYSGEDDATKEGGVLSLTKGLLERFGKSRIMNAPISEEAIAAVGAGRALAGGRPFFEFQFAPFFREASRVFRHVVAPQWFEKKCRFPFVSVFPSGIVHEGGSAEYHEGWVERDLLPMAGIAVVAPCNAYEVAGLVRGAYESGWPVAILLQISAAASSEFASDVPLAPFSIPLGKADVVREGTDYTVVTYGAACVAAARNEAEFLAKEGLSVEVINLRTVHPWDKETVMASLRKTGRIVFMHEDYGGDGSVGQMLVGMLAQEKDAFATLCLPHIPVLGAATPFVPTDTGLVWDRLPYERIISEDGKRKFHRSRKLAALIKDGMRYGRWLP